MIRTGRRLLLCIAILIFLLAFIWGNSLLPAEKSQALSDWVQELLTGIRSDAPSAPHGSGLLRKIAHFTEYSALGMCLAWLFGMLQKGKLLPFLCGAAAACIDETIQCFVPDRGPGILDVGLDCCGVLTGMILLYLGHTYLTKKSIDHSVEDNQ